VAGGIFLTEMNSIRQQGRLDIVVHDRQSVRRTNERHDRTQHIARNRRLGAYLDDAHATGEERRNVRFWRALAWIDERVDSV